MKRIVARCSMLVNQTTVPWWIAFGDLYVLFYSSYLSFLPITEIWFAQFAIIQPFSRRWFVMKYGPSYFTIFEDYKMFPTLYSLNLPLQGNNYGKWKKCSRVTAWNTYRVITKNTRNINHLPKCASKSNLKTLLKREREREKESCRGTLEIKNCFMQRVPLL